jgi:peptidoglycan/LPS O-acetylase OafA/YrhL
LNAGKLAALESVRGLAALVVVFSHLIGGFIVGYHDAEGPVSPLMRFWNQGGFAVDVFFILSGFVLSLSFLRTGQYDALWAAAVRRYWRLLIPVAASITLSYGLLGAGLFANREAAAAMHQPDSTWLNMWYGFEPSLKDAGIEAVYGVFFDFQNTHTYNPVLWTMGAEFIGSMCLFAFLALFGRRRCRVLAYLAAALAIHACGPFWLIEFLAGAAMCDLYLGWKVERFSNRPAVAFVSIVLVASGLFLAGLTRNWFASKGFAIPGAAELKHCYALGAAFVLAGVLISAPLQQWLSAKPLVFLGKVSFPLYLVHVLVECSLGCRVYLACLGHVSHGGAFAAAAGATLAVSFVLAWVGSITVEPWSIAVGRYVFAMVCSLGTDARSLGLPRLQFQSRTISTAP